MDKNGSNTKESYSKVIRRSLPGTELLLPQTIKSGQRKGGCFPCGKLHPKYVPLQERRRQMASLSVGTLTLRLRTLKREGSYWVINGKCKACGNVWVLSCNNLYSGKTKNCRCQRHRKYPQDGRAETLGQRYDSMIQRCRRDTHVSSHNYKGRGIKVLFESREDFIWWALKKFPETDFKGLDFDRENNDGHYSKENLRLVTRKENLANTRPRKKRERCAFTI